MLSNFNQQVNVNAMSVIDGKQVTFMNANIRSGEAPMINVSYQDVALYNDNKEDVDADFEEFKSRVFAIGQGGLDE